MLTVHVKDVLIFSKNKHWIDILIKSLADKCEKFELADEKHVNKCLSADVTTYPISLCELK